MRTIIVLAVLALACSAFDLEAYNQGFSQQMGFTTGEIQDGYTCFAGISQIIGTLKTKLQAGDLNAFLQAAQAAKPQFLTACGPYFGDFSMYALTHTNGQQPTQNLEKFAPQVIQQLAIWVNYIKAGQDSEAGQTEAYILQVLIGAQQPTVLPVPQIDSTKIAQFNEDTFFQQYLGAFFSTMGLAQEVDLTTIPPCIQAMTTVAQSFPQMEMTVMTSDFDGKLDAIQTFVDGLIQGVKSCQGAFQADALLLVPIYEALVEDPISFILNVVDNVATNFPEILQSIQQEQVDIVEGDYTDAGDLKAQRLQTVFNGLVNFTN